jgi:hypothetical protein
MSGRGDVCADDECQDDDKSKVMSLLVGVLVLDWLYRGMQIAVDRHQCGVN